MGDTMCMPHHVPWAWAALTPLAACAARRALRGGAQPAFLDPGPAALPVQVRSQPQMRRHRINKACFKKQVQPPFE